MRDSSNTFSLFPGNRQLNDVRSRYTSTWIRSRQIFQTWTPELVKSWLSLSYSWSIGPNLLFRLTSAYIRNLLGIRLRPQLRAQCLIISLHLAIGKTWALRPTCSRTRCVAAKDELNPRASNAQLGFSPGVHPPPPQPHTHSQQGQGCMWRWWNCEWLQM